MKYMEQARKMRPILEKAVQFIDGDEAVQVADFYPAWEPGTGYTAGHKVNRSGQLWRCVQAHTALTGWEPENAPSLWEQINEIHSGQLSDPIPYNGNMALTAGLYYIQYGRIYLCIRDTVTPVYSPLAELTGLYVETAA